MSTALVVTGLVILLDVGLTLAWSEPVSTLHGWLEQRQAASELEQLERSFEPRRSFEQNKVSPELLAGELHRAAKPGDAIGRMLVPAISLNAVAVEGTDSDSLKKGPGHYPATGLPGQGTTVAIAGHRTTYLAPFRRINELGPGDEITVEMPYGTFAYRFEKQRIVDPYQVGVVRDVGYERLVLTACHPLYSAAQRIVVFARLVPEERETARPRPSAERSASPAETEIATAGLGPALAGASGLVLIALGGWALGERSSGRSAREGSGRRAAGRRRR